MILQVNTLPNPFLTINDKPIKVKIKIKRKPKKGK